MRQTLVRLHRWFGLVIACFLVVAGLTGSLLAWTDELEALVSPALFLASPAGPGPAMDPLELRARVQAAFPHTFVARAPLQVEPGRTLALRLYALPPPSGGAPPDLADDQVFINPWTGHIQDQRKWGDIRQGWKNLMPFVLRLHDSLALDIVGSYLMGLAALLWTIDCFVGAWLTLPARATRQDGPSWLRRWRPAWGVRWGAGSHKLNFDLHRAGGLWPWAMLFVLAWSSVSFNLREVYDPVMHTLLKHQPDRQARPLARPLLQPAVDWHAARDIGRAQMALAARTRGFKVLSEYMLIYDPRIGLYNYYARTSLDVSERWGITRVDVDARTGQVRGLWLPTAGASGDTVRTWLTTLHMAAVGGMPMRIFISVMGLVVAMLSVTGVLIWLKKRRASIIRDRLARQRQLAIPPP